jgi:hypothetical protein
LEGKKLVEREREREREGETEGERELETLDYFFVFLLIQPVID